MLPTGGTITTATIDGKDYRIHTFAEDGVFVVAAPLDVEYFLVGGGGRGATIAQEGQRGCGAAGGKVVHNLDGDLLAVPAGLHPVTVGAGATSRDGVNGGDGGDSAVFGISAPGGEGGQGTTRGGNQGGIGGHLGGLAQTETSPTAGGGGAGDGADGGAGIGSVGGNGGDGSYHNPDGNPRHFGGGGGARGSPPGAGCPRPWT